jgi:hypothetical protein
MHACILTRYTRHIADLLHDMYLAKGHPNWHKLSADLSLLLRADPAFKHEVRRRRISPPLTEAEARWRERRARPRRPCWFANEASMQASASNHSHMTRGNSCQKLIHKCGMRRRSAGHEHHARGPAAVHGIAL